MHKIKSVGVTVLGNSLIIASIILLFFFSGLIIPNIRYSGVNKDTLLPIIFLLLPSIYHFIVGIGILKLKEWARRFSFWILSVGLLLSPVYLFFGGFALYPRYMLGFLLVFSLIIYWILAITSFIYLTRSKVKELFK